MLTNVADIRILQQLVPDSTILARYSLVAIVFNFKHCIPVEAQRFIIDKPHLLTNNQDRCNQRNRDCKLEYNKSLPYDITPGALKEISF